MKRSVTIIIVVALCLTFLVGVTPSLFAEKAKYKFAVVYPATSLAFAVPVKKGMEVAADLLGVEAVFTGPPQMDMVRMRDICEDLINSGIDGLALPIQDPDAFDELVRDALDRGIPVVGYNVDDPTPNARMCFIGQDLYQSGIALGEEMSKLVGEGGHVVIGVEAPGQSWVIDRSGGAQEVFKKYNITWDEIDTTQIREQALTAFMSYYYGHQNTTGFCGVGAMSSAMAGLAVKKLGLDPDKVHAGGFDLIPLTLELIKEGYMDFTIDQYPFSQGFYSIIVLYLYREYDIYPHDVPTGAGIVNAENVDFVMKLVEQSYR